jgi:beta-glucosidase
LKSVAVIGPRSDEVVRDWYGSTPAYAVTPLAGIKNKLGSGVAVEHADGKDVAAAVALAKSSDVAIVCVGNSPNADNKWMKVNDDSEGREGIDRQNITLGSGQEDLVKEVFAANPKTVVVLISSFPYAINWAQENIPAILHLAHSSQEQGNALADVLFGDYNPAGRLCQTWPKSLEQIPPMLDYNIRHGRTYMYFKGQPLYPFGYGLSYTTFQFSKLEAPATAAAGATVSVSFDVTNTGNVAGAEVAQLYVSDPSAHVDRPERELKGFSKVRLAPGETRHVTLALDARAFSYWDEPAHKWTIDPGKFIVRVGDSSENTPLSAEIDLH